VHALHLEPESRQLVAGDDAGSVFWWDAEELRAALDQATPAAAEGSGQEEQQCSGLEFAAFPGAQLAALQVGFASVPQRVRQQHRQPRFSCCSHLWWEGEGNAMGCCSC
jgi:hypothetical protein